MLAVFSCRSIMETLLDDGRTIFRRMKSIRSLVLQLFRGEVYGDPFIDFMTFFQLYKSIIIDIMMFVNHPAQRTLVKAVFYLKARMNLFNSEGALIKSDDAWFQTSIHNYSLQLSNSKREEYYNQVIADVARQIAQYTKQSSGWSFGHVISFDMSLAQYSMFAGMGKLKQIPKLPDAMKNKQSILKVQVRDDATINCFQAALNILVYLSKEGKCPDNSSHYSSWEKLFNGGPVFPEKCCDDGVDVDDIHLFENENPRLFITVLGYEKADFYLLRRFKYERYEQMENKEEAVFLYLLLHKEHYFPIKSINALMQKTKNNYDYICPFCLYAIRKKESWKAHMTYCAHTKPQVITMPDEGECITFGKMLNSTHHHPFVFYADTESYLQPGEMMMGNKTKVLNTHVPCAVGYYLAINDTMKKVMEDDMATEMVTKHLPEFPHGLYKSFTGDGDCFTQFLESLYDITERLTKLFGFWKKKMPVGFEKERLSATHCVLCSRAFNKENVRVIDHDHWTGEYVGIAHQACNLQVRAVKRFFPVYFHNWKGYDAHLLCKTAKFSKREQVEIGCIPTSTEKYLSMSLKWKVGSFRPFDEDRIITLKNELRFLDSCQYLSSSLAHLIDLQYRDLGVQGFPHSINTNPDNFELVASRKGVFPYSYFDGMEKLNDTCLPPIEAFANDLNDGEPISQQDYDHATNVWRKTNCKNLGDYLSVYLKSDIIGLADVFENFRTICESAHHMDPIFFYSLPGFAWQSALRQTQIELKLLTDYNMYTMLERGIRGGMTVCTRHHIQASNFYTNPEKYTDPNDEDSTYIFTLDANSLYAWALSQPLPVGDFEWIKEEELSSLFPMELDQWPDMDGDVGYILEVDLTYPGEIQRRTATYPLAPAHETIRADSFTIEMLEQWKQSCPVSKYVPDDRKLIASCNPKEQYVVHGKNLHFYLSQGMQLNKIHSVIRFSQKSWLAPYISGNIEKRKTATSTSRSDFYKLSNNAVFGKTTEKIRNRSNFSLYTDERKIQAAVNKASYAGSIIFSQELAGIYSKRNNVKLNQPIYIGFSVLELSKLHMFRFFYEVIQPLFMEDEACEVMYTDTDSLHLRIKGKNIISKLQSIRDEWIDGSNLPVDHPLHCLHNKGIIGKFKEEMDGKTITDIVALRPKMYSIKTSDGSIKKRAKGVKKSALQNKINFDHYMKVYLNEMGPISVDQVTIQSRRHEVFTIKQTRKALSLFDNKRVWTSKNYSVPFGSIAHNCILHAEEFAQHIWFERNGKKTKSAKLRKPYQPPNDIIRKRKRVKSFTEWDID